MNPVTVCLVFLLGGITGEVLMCWSISFSFKNSTMRNLILDSLRRDYPEDF